MADCSRLADRLELTLMEIIRQVRQYFVAHVWSGSGLLAEQAHRVILGGNRRTEDLQ